MPFKTRITARTSASLSLLLGLLACGGGGDADDTAAASTAPLADTANAEPTGPGAARATVQAVAANPAPGTLRLVSATPAGQPRGGSVCALSADGKLVLFSSDATTLVAGDTNGASDLFLKNLQTGSVSRVNTSSTGAQMLGGAQCLAMTPDGTSVAFTATVSTPGAIYPGGGGSETVIMVKNLASGQLSRATPPLSSLPTTQGYRFAGLADDGKRLAFVAQPTTTYLGGYLTAYNGPARLLLADLPSGTVSNLESVVRWPANNGTDPQFGQALLSPNGQQLAFTAGVDYPEAGDRNGKNDVFLLDLNTLAVRLLSTTSAGVQVLAQSPTLNPPYELLSFLSGGQRLAFSLGAASSLGPDGVYFKQLQTGAVSLGLALGTSFQYGGPLSFSDDGRRVAFIRYVSNSPQAFVRHLATGQDQAVATTASGLVGKGISSVSLISRDGLSAGFNSSATNLVSGTSQTFRLESYVKTLPALSTTP